MTQKHLYLDLEDTIITPVVEGWANVELINVDKIKQVIVDFQPDFVHLFSFAIWNEYERNQFNQHTRARIEEALDIEIWFTPTVDDHILPTCCRAMGIDRSTVDFSEMSSFWGKAGAFRLCMYEWWRKTSVDVDVLLLDDAVLDEDFFWKELAITARIRNIDKLERL